MKTQVFIDGNKRAAVIFANHFMIARGQGFLVIPEAYAAGVKKFLAACYEGEDSDLITAFQKAAAGRLFSIWIRIFKVRSYAFVKREKRSFPTCRIECGTMKAG